jgi:hypothetical protein
MVVMVTMHLKQSKSTDSKAHLTPLKVNNCKTTEAMGLKITA